MVKALILMVREQSCCPDGLQVFIYSISLVAVTEQVEHNCRCYVAPMLVYNLLLVLDSGVWRISMLYTQEKSRKRIDLVFVSQIVEDGWEDGQWTCQKVMQTSCAELTVSKTNVILYILKNKCNIYIYPIECFNLLILVIVGKPTLCIMHICQYDHQTEDQDQQKPSFMTGERQGLDCFSTKGSYVMSRAKNGAQVLPRGQKSPQS